MITDPLSAIAVIALVAVASQLIAARAQVPSVLILLMAGVGLGPVLDPDEVFGELLFTAVGIGVAVLLFEGATTLRWRDLTIGRAPVLRLVTVGAAIAWAVGTATAALVLDVDIGTASMLSSGTGKGAQFCSRSFFRPWNIPQSTRTRPLAASRSVFAAGHGLCPADERQGGCCRGHDVHGRRSHRAHADPRATRRTRFEHRRAADQRRRFCLTEFMSNEATASPRYTVEDAVT